MGEGVSTDFKSSNEIEISWLVQVLLNFDWFQGSPLGGDGWVDGCGCGCGCVGKCPMHAWTHAHACMCMHAHTHMHVKYDKHGCLHVGGHMQFLYMYTCACVWVHACVWGHPMLPDIPTHLPLPRATGSPKHQNSISPELIKITRFCTCEHSRTHIDYSCSPWISTTHLPHPPEPRKPKSEELQ